MNFDLSEKNTKDATETNFDLSEKNTKDLKSVSSDEDDSNITSAEIIGGTRTTVTTKEDNLIHTAARSETDADQETVLTTTIKNVVPVRNLTQEDIKKDLRLYLLVPKEQWDHISKGTHLRYVGTDDKYRRGGFVINKYVRDEQKFFQLSTRKFGKPGMQGFHTWPVDFSKIKLLYKKQADASSIEISLIRRELAMKNTEIVQLREELFNASEHRYRLEALIEKQREDFNLLKGVVKKIIKDSK